MAKYIKRDELPKRNMHGNTNSRPCYVEGYDNRAIFHKWVKCQKVLLNSSVNLRLEAVKEECKYLSRYGFIQGKCEPVIIEEIYALIEYEDGRVDLVYPDQVRFVDRLINEYIFDFDFDKHCRFGERKEE